MSPSSRASQPRQPAPPRSGRLLRLPLPDTDAALVAALRAGREDAREEIVRRCAGDVERVLYRVLGPDPDVEDLMHDVFVAALTSLHQLRQPDALRSWLVGIALRKVRKLLVRRKRWRFVLSMPGDLPDREAAVPSADISEALRSTYRILTQLPVDDRLAFALRHIDGMALAAVAELTNVSLATAKRRIARAHRRFVELASKNDVLAPWVASGDLAS